MGEIGDGDDLLADLPGELSDFLMRALEEFVEKAEFIHELERGGMNSVAAKIAEEIAMLFEDDCVDACAGEEEPEHHTGGSSSGNAAAGVKSLGHTTV